MRREITRRDGASPIETLRALMTLDADDATSITKIAVKDGTRGLMVRGISLPQRWNEVRFGEALLAELEDMRHAGQIRDDFNRTDAGVSSLREFFEMIDGKPDEERFRTFCALFMSANAPAADSNEAILDLELMSIIRTLSAGQMHLLIGLLKLRSYKIGDDLMGSIAKELGYRADALVMTNIQTLIACGLVDQDGWSNQSGTVGNRKQLVTDLGIALLKRIQKYNEFKENQNRAANHDVAR